MFVLKMIRCFLFYYKDKYTNNGLHELDAHFNNTPTLANVNTYTCTIQMYRHFTIKLQ